MTALTGDDGVLKQLLQAGSGPTPSPRQTVFAHYTGVFDSSAAGKTCDDKTVKYL